MHWDISCNGCIHSISVLAAHPPHPSSLFFGTLKFGLVGGMRCVDRVDGVNRVDHVDRVDGADRVDAVNRVNNVDGVNTVDNVHSVNSVDDVTSVDNRKVFLLGLGGGVSTVSTVSQHLLHILDTFARTWLRRHISRTFAHTWPRRQRETERTLWCG